MTRTPSMTWKAGHDVASRPWQGRVRDYDLFNEVAIGFVVVAAVTLGLAGIFGSPDEPAVTFASWSSSGACRSEKFSSYCSDDSLPPAIPSLKRLSAIRVPAFVVMFFKQASTFYFFINWSIFWINP